METFATGSTPRSVAVGDVNDDGKIDLVVANGGDNTVRVLLGNGDGTFQNQRTVAAGIYPASAEVADVNGDGKPDLVVVNFGADQSGYAGFDYFTVPLPSTVSVLLGDGHGGFQNLPAFTTGDGPVSVAAADLNGDGKPDLIVANLKGNSVSVLLGNGDGTFQTQQTVATGYQPRSVAAVDVNSDGKPDLVVAGGGSFGPGWVSVLLGNGDGTFQKPQTFRVGNDPHAVAAVDVNGDGIPDIIVAGDGGVSVLLGNGDGTFQNAQTFAAGESPYAVAVADVNGDGKPDLVVANANFGSLYGSVSVLLGNGNGSFQQPRSIATIRYPVSVVVADVNGDGKPDIIVAGRGGASVLLGNGHGTFQKQLPVLAAGGYPDSVAVADVNGDGKPDLLFANRNNNDVSVLLGNGNGTFQNPKFISTGDKPYSLTVADVNGDGKPDILVANYGDNNVSVLLGASEDDAQKQQTFPVGKYPDSVAAADLNGDGKIDLVTANKYDNSVSVLDDYGDGTFQKQQTFAVGQRPSFVAVADVNGDGIPDIIVANEGSDSVSVLLGEKDGSFEEQQTFAAGNAPISVAVADVNGDGKPDLIVANYSENTVSVLLGNGDGAFQNEQTFFAGYEPRSLAVADVNGDGIPDLIVCDSGFLFNSGRVSVLLGNGNGTFQEPHSFATGYQPRSVAVADVNGDGKPDLIVANANFGGPGSVSVLLGTGDGFFQAPSTFSTGAAPVSVAVADVNGDGVPDIITANFIDNSVSVLLGNGDGSFQNQRMFAAGQAPYSVAVADVNGDGKPDILVANSADNDVSILLGNGDGSFPNSIASTLFVPASPTSGVGLRNTPYPIGPDGASVILDRSGNILFRAAGSAADDSFAPPQILNSGRPARSITVLKNGDDWAVAAADAQLEPAPSSPGDQGYTISLYTMGADGSFTSSTAFSTPFLPTDIAAADLTGDGLDDIIVANSLNDSVSVAFQSRPGQFASPITLPVGSAPSDIALVDVNGDGLLDIVVSDQASGDVTVLLNDARHSFTTMARFRVGTGVYDLQTGSPEQPVSLAAGDFLSNGRNDLVVVNRGTDNLTVLANDGNGGFANPQADLSTSLSDGLLVNDQPGPLVAGYFNGLGQPLDVAVLMEDRAQVWIYTGDGHGHFTHTATIDAGALPTGLSVGPGPFPAASIC